MKEHRMSHTENRRNSFVIHHTRRKPDEIARLKEEAKNAESSPLVIQKEALEGENVVENSPDGLENAPKLIKCDIRKGGLINNFGLIMVSLA